MNCPLGCEQAEDVAIRLIRAAFDISSAHQIVRSLCATAPDVIRAEIDALDALDDHAEDMAVALRQIAMRLDRAALVKFQSERGDS